MSDRALKDIVDAQIKRLSGLVFEFPTFPKALEDRFELDTGQQRCARLWFEGLLTLLLYNLFLIADYVSIPATFWHAVAVRMCIITPIGLLVNVNMRRTPNRIYRESSVACVACMAGISHLYLEGGQSPVLSAFAQLGLVAVILVANTLMRVRFWYALASTAVMLAADLVFLNDDQLLSFGQKILGLSLGTSAAIVTMISNYSFDREERLNYLLRLRGDLMVGQLHRSKERFQQMAQRDALTGLANRRYFDARLEELWKLAQTNHGCLSIVIVDVDRFKRLNDTYGHLYGDRVLQRIAHLLAEALRRKDDLAARFGGEEFVVLLPATDLVSAIAVAERLRSLVEVAGLPALDSLVQVSAEITATVSCGVATAYPTSFTGAQNMLNEADKALYRAKEGGRNRVCCA